MLLNRDATKLTCRLEDGSTDRCCGHPTGEIVLPSHSVNRRVDSIVHQSYIRESRMNAIN
jgi:hypothetical protein